MDYVDSKELIQTALQINKFANELREKLVKQAEMKVKLDNMLSVRMEELLKVKKNIGTEMAIILSLKNSVEFQDVYNQQTILSADCDGLKKVIESLHCMIVLSQSLMKFTQKEIS